MILQTLYPAQVGIAKREPALQRRQGIERRVPRSDGLIWQVGLEASEAVKGGLMPRRTRGVKIASRLVRTVKEGRTNLERLHFGGRMGEISAVRCAE